MDNKSITKKILQTVGSLLIAYLLFLVVEEFYRSAPTNGQLPLGFTTNWGIGFVALIVSCLLLYTGALFAIWAPEKARRAAQVGAGWRERLGWLRWLLACAVAVFPAWFLIYSKWGNFFTGPYIRLFILIMTSAAFGALTTTNDALLIFPKRFVFGLVLIASLHLAADRLADVSNYPFSLTWSEGNRLYDFSIYVDPYRYIYPGKAYIPYKSPGRYMLWGVLFAIPDTPIWAHRLWDAILWIVPSITLGYLMARWSNRSNLIKWSFALWVFIFLAQGPIYPPLLLSAIVVVSLVHYKHWISSFIGCAIAAFYATISRWTWLLAAPTWAVLILLSSFEIESDKGWKNAFRRLFPIALVGIAGVLVGSLADPQLLSPAEIATGGTFQQPLLWYRLLPNPTYPFGIVIGLLIAAGPLAVLLVWLTVRKYWHLDWLKMLAYSLAGLAFMVMGLIASVKIGGGSNLHNLDMFLVTLVIIAGLAYRDVENFRIERLPVWIRGLLILIVILPAWSAIRIGAPRNLPTDAQVNEALEVIQTKVESAQRRGEVLFLDQRQLLTFGYIKNVPLVPDYEKKYMMDRAMGGSKTFFEGFYQDLANQRFRLIVSEPLYWKEGGAEVNFQEENAAWTHWVARPLLCFYAPITTIPEVRIQLLVPRESPLGCPLPTSQ